MGEAGEQAGVQIAAEGEGETDTPPGRGGASRARTAVERELGGVGERAREPPRVRTAQGAGSAGEEGARALREQRRCTVGERTSTGANETSAHMPAGSAVSPSPGIAGGSAAACRLGARPLPLADVYVGADGRPVPVLLGRPVGGYPDQAAATGKKRKKRPWIGGTRRPKRRASKKEYATRTHVIRVGKGGVVESFEVRRRGGKAERPPGGAAEDTSSAADGSEAGAPAADDRAHTAAKDVALVAEGGMSMDSTAAAWDEHRRLNLRVRAPPLPSWLGKGRRFPA